MEVGVRQPPCAREMGFETFCAWAAKEGFKAIDVPRLTAEVKQALDNHGLKVGTVDMPNWGGNLSPDPEAQKKALEEQKRILSEEAALGAHTVFAVLLPGDHSQPRAKTFEIWKQTYPDVVKQVLVPNNLQFAIEAWFGPGPNHPSIGCTPEMLRPMFAAVDSPNLGLCYDPSHLIRVGIDHMRFLWEFGERVKHVHGKDTEIIEEQLYLTGNLGPSFAGKYGYGESAWRYTIPGEGSADWVTIANRLRDFGYDGFVCVELEDHYYFPSVEQQQQGLVNSLRYLNEVIG